MYSTQLHVYKQETTVCTERLRSICDRATVVSVMDPIVIDSDDSDFEPTTGHCLGLVAADGPVTKVGSESED